MKNNPLLLNGSAAEVSEQLQESYDRLLDNTKRWAEILTFDPDPQTGMTPKDVVWRKNKAKLYRYISADKCRSYRVPILVLYALINEAYILDLTPGMSMVEHLVDQGFDVYMLEWGDFAWEDRDLTMADIIFDYIAYAAHKVCQFSQTDELSIIGYCMGGTMASIYASMVHFPRIKNMVFMAAPFDFADAGTTSIWLKDPGYDVDKIVDTLQLVPSSFIDFGVKLLNPVNNFYATYTRLWKMLDQGVPVHSWKVLNKWVNDNKNLPGAFYRQWIKDFYQENKLIKNEVVMRGQRVDLSNIQASVLVLGGTKDHIVLPHQTNILLNFLEGSDKAYHEFPIGHGGLVFGDTAKNMVYPLIADWLGSRS